MALRRTVVTTLVASTLAGCVGGAATGRLPIFVERAPAAQLAEVRRVMVLPLRNADGVTADTTHVRDSLARALVRLGRFEVTPLPPGAEEQDAIYRSVLRDTLAPRDLVALGERYQIDAVVLGTVTVFRPYEPPRFGLRTDMLSLQDGSKLWHAEVVLDAKDAAVEADVQAYAETVQAEEASLHGWRMTLLSPMRFVDYGTYRIADTLR